MSDPAALQEYLNDHLSAGSGAIDMAEHCREVNGDEPLAGFMATLVAEIQADHQILQDLMANLDATQNRVKQVAARMGEKVSRLKLGSGDLGNLLALESLSLGIEGKAGMWKVLELIDDGREAFASVDFDVLIERANSQRDAVERWRLAVAEVALKEGTA